MQQGTAIIHMLESQEEESSIGLKCNEPQNSLSKESRTGISSRFETWQDTEATHRLKSQEQVLSASLKHSKANMSLTSWCINNRLYQQDWNAVKKPSHSQSEEPRTGIIITPDRQQDTAVTHRLESQRQVSSAGLLHRKTQQPLTAWRAKNRHHQQAWYTARHSSHSHTEEPRTGIISRPDTQQDTAASHILESQGQASSAGLIQSKTQQPLTLWRAKNRHHQQAWYTARHSSHSHTREPRTSIISRLDTQQDTAATHFLKSQEQASSAGLIHGKT